MRVLLCACIFVLVSFARAEEQVSQPPVAAESIAVSATPVPTATPSPSPTQIMSPTPTPTSAPAAESTPGLAPVLEPAPEATPRPTPRPPPPTPTPVQQFSVSFFTASSGTANFPNGNVSVGSPQGAFQMDLEVGPTSGVGFEFRNMPTNSIGVQTGLELEASREINKVTLHTSSGSGSAIYSAPKPKIQSSNVYVNAVYRWDQLYLLFGLNRSFVTYYPSGFGGSTTSYISGGIGVELGVGLIFNQSFSLELQSHVTGVNGYESGNGTTAFYADYGYGTLSDVRILGKLTF